MPVSWVKNGVSASILRGQGTCATFALHALSLEEISLAAAELFFRGALRDPSGSPLELGVFDQVKGNSSGRVFQPQKTGMELETH